jgi:proton-dependent oligopeptide transporter, POT family
MIERMSYYGARVLYYHYIALPNPGTATGRPIDPSDEDAQPGALGLGDKPFTGVDIFNQFFLYLLPLLGGWVADTYLGRFKSLIWSIIIMTVGHMFMTVSALTPVLEAWIFSVGFFFVGFVVLSVGTGTFKPNIIPFMAEQIHTQDIKIEVREGGTRVLVDPAATLGRVFIWFYLFINSGMVVGSTSIVSLDFWV